MRVLFVTGEYPPMQGGVGDYTWKLGSALAGLGIDVHVLSSEDAGPAHLLPAGVENVYPVVRRWGWGTARQVNIVVANIAPDVVHIQYQSAAFDLHPAINLLPRSLRGRPVSVAVTFHDLRTPYLFPKAGPLRWRAVLDLARSSQAAIVTNAEDQLRLRAYPELASRLHEIPIGANVLPDLPADFDRALSRARYGVDPADLLMCYFGFLNESKGGEELMDALALLVGAGLPVHLLMIGGQVGSSDPTNAAYLEHVRQRVAALGLQGRVHWTGFVGADEVSAAFAASDVAVLPYRDGASFRRGSLMAALAHGMPIVSTAPAVAIPEMEHGNNIWLVETRSPAALAGAVEMLWRDRGLLEGLRRGAETLASCFTWEAIARKHVETYRELI
ncbi:MAG: glycosyltransferase family 4 protein [Caldilineales bacterium]